MQILKKAQLTEEESAIMINAGKLLKTIIDSHEKGELDCFEQESVNLIGALYEISETVFKRIIKK